jgi:hypothetical protein
LNGSLAALLMVPLVNLGSAPGSGGGIFDLQRGIEVQAAAFVGVR